MTDLLAQDGEQMAKALRLCLQSLAQAARPAAVPPRPVAPATSS